MHPVRKRKLMLVLTLFSIFAIAIGLGVYALRQNIDLFFLPEQVVNGEAPLNQRMRLGGMVKAGSVIKSSEAAKVRFVLFDEVSEVTVEYEGILPDLFREGQGIVAIGRLENRNIFVASQVLAKHDENYMPPEIEKKMNQAHEKSNNE